MGSYHVPAKYLLKNILNAEIIDVPKITNKTVELGNRYSPDFICSPFKYTLGSLIEGLDLGANILVQYGGGCRYGYYSELQKQILKDLGYKFTMINLITAGKTDIKRIYKELSKVAKVKKIKSMFVALNAMLMVKCMDKIDIVIRKNAGFEMDKNSFNDLREKYLKELSSTKGILNTYRIYKKYNKLFNNLYIKKPDKPIKIGIIGELYTLMEPYSNYNIEQKLLNNKIEITRFTNVDYLLFKKKKYMKKVLKKSSYIKNKMGADAADNICRTEFMCRNGYDGIIHIKSSFCTPEIGAMPIINKICLENNVPVLFMSFDTMTSEVGINTRLEAFIDMLEMRHNND
jgi:predicted nucleotide-binding protein (sugar kinase/HSP70/actin superfamily)